MFYSYDPQETANQQRLYRLTKTILNAHFFHFFTISLLFIPFTFFASTSIQFYFSSSPDPTDDTAMFDPFNVFLIKTMVSSSRNNLLIFKTLVTIFTYICFVILPTVASVALITFNTNQAIRGKPITFSSALKSLSRSYIPLLYTFVVGLVKIMIIFLVFTLSPIVCTKAIKALGFHFDLVTFSVLINIIVWYALVATIVFFITIWGSASAITVLESKSGFESLRQSTNQSTEFRRHSYSIVITTGLVMGTTLASSASVFYISGPKEKWMSIFYIGARYMLVSLIFLFYVVANTVLYVQCKVSIGEEIATMTVNGKVSGEDVKVDVNDSDNDSKVMNEVAKEEASGSFTYMLYVLYVVWMILIMSATFLYVLSRRM